MIIIGLVAVLLSNCTIQKRLYLPGYSIAFKKSNQLKENEELKKVVDSKEKNVVLNQLKSPVLDTLEYNSTPIQLESQTLTSGIEKQKPILQIKNSVKFLIPFLKQKKSSTINQLKSEWLLQKLHKDSPKEKHEKRVIFFLVMFLILILSFAITVLGFVSTKSFQLYISLFILAILLGFLAIVCLIALISQIIAGKKVSEPINSSKEELQTNEQLKDEENKKIRFKKVRIGFILLFFLLLSIFTFSVLF